MRERREEMSRILKYEQKDTWIDELTGVTKLLFFLLWSVVSMITYDTRVLLVMLVLSVIIFLNVQNQLEAGRDSV